MTSPHRKWFTTCKRVSRITAAEWLSRRAYRSARSRLRARRARRIGTAGFAFALLSTGCQARGGGWLSPNAAYVGDPKTGNATVYATYSGKATFGFTFTCEDRQNGKVAVRAELEYKDEALSTFEPFEALRTLTNPAGKLTLPSVALHGVTDLMELNVGAGKTCADQEAVYSAVFPDPSAAVFKGYYWTKTNEPTAICNRELLDEAVCRFEIIVDDVSEPGSLGPTADQADSFAIDIKGGDYLHYTRADQIEGGNIQVEP